MTKQDAPEGEQTAEEPTGQAEVAADADVDVAAGADDAGVSAASERTETAATVEALLVASDKPLTPQKLSQLGELGGVRSVRKAVGTLHERYERMACAFRIVEIAGGYQIQTTAEYNDVVSRLAVARREAKLSQAALETLAVVAYRQPVLRADIESIRGVACGEVLRGLMEKSLVRITGRAEEIGRPLLYGTTQHFLEVFGLAGLNDLPNAEQLRMPPETPTAAPASEADEANEDAADDAATEADTPEPADEQDAAS